MQMLVSLARLVFHIYIYFHIFHQNNLVAKLCGPLTIDPDESFLYIIIFIELVQCFYPLLSKFFELTRMRKLGLELKKSSLSSKYIFILCLKLMIIFGTLHRWKYYLHVIFLELIIFGANQLIDSFGSSQVALGLYRYAKSLKSFSSIHSP